MNAWAVAGAALLAAPLFVLVAPPLVARLPAVRATDPLGRSVVRLPRGLARWSVPLVFTLLAALVSAVLSYLAGSWTMLTCAFAGPFAMVKARAPAAWSVVALHAGIDLLLVLLFPLRPGVLTALLSAAAVGYWFLFGMAVAGLGC